MKSPLLRDDAFLASVAAARSTVDTDPTRTPLDLWWLGQSGFLLHWNHRFLLLDPYLSDSLTRKYALTDKPHVRMTSRVIAPECLDFIDVVTSSHSHTDHLDPETLQPLARANPDLLMVCPEASRATVRERSGLPDARILGLDCPPPPAPTFHSPTSPFPRSPQSTLSVCNFNIHAFPAAHESLDRDAQGRALYLGYVVELGPFRLYHSGDTVRFDGMAELLAPVAPDVALLPINGRAPDRRVAGNLDGREAAQLAHDIGARLVIPCHYDMFEFNTASPDEFESACDRRGQPCRVAHQGERITLQPLTRQSPRDPIPPAHPRLSR